MKRMLIKSGALAGLAVCCAASSFAEKKPAVVNKKAEKPNVVVFLVDDMGMMDTSVPFLMDEKGTPVVAPLNEWYRTPAMERLAAQGTRFSIFYAQSVCSPTRASIMTGQNATRHATTTWINPGSNNRGAFGPIAWNWRGLEAGDVTLPGVLKEAGYRTIHIGKAHFGPKDSEGAEPKNLGFDVNIGGAAWGRPESYLSENHYGNHPKYKNMTKKGKKVRTIRAVPHLEAYYDSGIFLTEALTLEAKKQIKQSVEAEKPFFLYMAHYALHSPFDADPRFIDNYADSDKPERARKFAALVEGMDKSLNDILDELVTLGVAEDTLVIFLGDNGTDAPLGEDHAIACSAPLRGKKATRYEGGIRVPFIAAWAKPNAGNGNQQKLPIVQGFVQTQFGTVMDLYPTILDVAGAENPEGHEIDGYGLKRLLSGSSDPKHPDTFLMHFPHDHRSKYFTSYRNGDWKLVYHYFPEMNKQSGHYELFNLKQDLSESRNLANQNPEKLQMMFKAMVAQLDAEGALYPVDADGHELRPIAP
ncbi:sulfatase [Pontiella agarivorans]|uniref:Sulfatase n=1 Tax=Pontiella agarivorans TaxID=3038953 RepID=A0ABU5MS70_9BACT|nr:sulfatase [Pontiella agarivorans]MDZ8117050.1 sulfatase [Pontiella agarivorans]